MGLDCHCTSSPYFLQTIFTPLKMIKNVGFLMFISLLSLPFRSFAQQDLKVMSSMILEKVTSPGQTYEGKIVIENISNRSHEVKAFQRDYFFDIKNGSKITNPGHLKRSNAKWITFIPDFTTIAPGGSYAIKYTITVPDSVNKDAVSGSYWSLLMVEEVPDKSPESTQDPNDREIRIIRTLQYGIQLITTIDNTGSRKIKFLNTKLVTNDTTGEKSLVVGLENSGNCTFRPQVYMEIYNSRGIKIGTFKGDSYLMHPGTSVQNDIDISTLKQGKYTALLIADGGAGALFGMQLKLDI